MDSGPTTGTAVQQTCRPFRHGQSLFGRTCLVAEDGREELVPLAPALATAGPWAARQPTLRR